jgi:hypothetical protein
VSDDSYYWYKDQFDSNFVNNDGSVASATFTSPRTITIDSANNLYVYGSAFTGYTGLRKISSAGVVSSIRDVASPAVLSPSGNSGYGIAVDSINSTLYVAQSGSIMRGVPVPTLTSATSVTLEKDVAYSAGSPAYTAVFSSAGTGLGTYTATTLSAGLVIDAATGLITGTPTATGTTTVTLGATDSNGTGTNTLTIIVATKPGVPTGVTPTASVGQVSVITRR